MENAEATTQNNMIRFVAEDPIEAGHTISDISMYECTIDRVSTSIFHEVITYTNILLIVLSTDVGYIYCPFPIPYYDTGINYSLNSFFIHC